jgi:single-strand DNA-binding protein
MYQKVMIIGRLGGDPVKRFTQNGKAVTSFNVATGRSWTDANGERHENTVWFKVAAWEKLAETCEKYLAKGKLVFIEGELAEPKPWQGTDGSWKASLELTARNVTFLSPSDHSNEGREERDEPARRTQPIVDVDDSEEIPF